MKKIDRFISKLVDVVTFLGRFLLDIGFDFRRLSNLKYLPRYIREFYHYRSLNSASIRLYPVLSDYRESAGSGRGHYFHQDLLVASFVFRDNPIRHIDVGSRIDGFVAHVASFRKIEVMDVRDLPATGHPNIEFRQADLINFNTATLGVYDSISCLHAIEHFGLGRYGDIIDEVGHIKGFNNLFKNLSSGGLMYISFPIASQSTVFFNAHRVFHPKDIFEWIGSDCAFTIERFDYVDDEGKLHLNEDLMSFDINLKYGCGIYTIRKG